MSSNDEILALIDDALMDWSVGPDAMRSGAPAGDRGFMPHAPRMPRPSVTPEQMAALAVRVNAAFQPFKQAMTEMARKLNTLALNPAFRKALGMPPLHDAHHPSPLCIDGHDYAQRRRARKRRGR